jgi:NAD(P)-dependent dehydrogenase (short-subunit alcohol dehydrogenase family)
MYRLFIETAIVAAEFQNGEGGDYMTGVLLITGGARGIGAATARMADTRGYTVAVNYRERRDAADEVVAHIEAVGGHAATFAGDVGVEADVVRLFDQVEAQLGPITALVNSAGITGNGTAVADYSGDTLARLMAVNVTGTMLCCREAVRRMSTARGGQGGAIVNVSSMAAAIGGRAGSVDYATSKAAVDCFTVGLAKEVGDQGIRVNSLRPGMTVSDMTERVHANPEARKTISATIAMDRIAEADEMAYPILWLLSDEASFISGAVVDASGGGFMIGDRAVAKR